MKHNFNITITLIIIGCFFLTGCMTSKADLETAKIEYLDDTYEVQKIECNEQEQYCRIKYKHTQTGAEDYIDTLGVSCEKGEKGDPGEKGEKGDAGPKGDKGKKGERGAAFDYDDFTPEQLQMLKGDKGDPGMCSCGENDTDSTTDENYVVGKGFSVDDLSAEEIEELKEALGLMTEEEPAEIQRYVYEGWFNTDDEGDSVVFSGDTYAHWKKIPIEHITLNNMPLVQVFVKKNQGDILPSGSWKHINSDILNSVQSAVSYDEGYVNILFKTVSSYTTKHMDGNYKIVIDKSLVKTEAFVQELSGCKLLTIDKNEPTNHFNYQISADFSSDSNEVNFSVITPEKSTGFLLATYGDLFEQSAQIGELKLIQEENECVLTPLNARIWACFAGDKPEKQFKVFCPNMKKISLNKDEEFTYYGNLILFEGYVDSKDTFSIIDPKGAKSIFKANDGDGVSESDTINNLRIVRDEKDCYGNDVHSFLKICIIDDSISIPTSGCDLLTLERGVEKWHYGHTIELTDISSGGDIGYFEVIHPDGSSSMFKATYSDDTSDESSESETFDSLTLLQYESDCFISPTSAMLWACFGNSRP